MRQSKDDELAKQPPETGGCVMSPGSRGGVGGRVWHSDLELIPAGSEFQAVLLLKHIFAPLHPKVQSACCHADATNILRASE